MLQWPIICVVVITLTVLVNPKLRLVCIFVEQFKIYKNDRTNRYSMLDFLTFLIVPILLAILVSFNMPFVVIAKHAGTIITVFSLIATLPLSFLALFIDKILAAQKEKEVAKEAFVSITVDIMYAMLLIGTVVVGVFIELSQNGERFLVGIIAFLAIKMVFNIMMILKRIIKIREIEP